METFHLSDVVSATEQTGCRIFTEYSVGVIVNCLTLHSVNRALRYIYVRITKDVHTLI
jgi:hypothetical protein